ncbi:creatininase family protein, partial [Streptomyces sp. NPDC048277]
MSGSGARTAAYGLLPADTTEEVRTRGAGVSTQVAVLPV